MASTFIWVVYEIIEYPTSHTNTYRVSGVFPGSSHLTIHHIKYVIQLINVMLGIVDNLSYFPSFRFEKSKYHFVYSFINVIWCNFIRWANAEQAARIALLNCITKLGCNNHG